eukprot:1388810-Rhodomonas_salina.1
MRHTFISLKNKKAKSCVGSSGCVCYCAGRDMRVRGGVRTGCCGVGCGGLGVDWRRQGLRLGKKLKKDIYFYSRYATNNSADSPVAAQARDLDIMADRDFSDLLHVSTPSSVNGPKYTPFLYPGLYFKCSLLPAQASAPAHASPRTACTARTAASHFTLPGVVSPGDVWVAQHVHNIYDVFSLLYALLGPDLRSGCGLGCGWAR